MIPNSQEHSLARLDAVAKLMDGAFVIPGTSIRMGLDGIIGFIPGIGDVVSGIVSSYLIWEARRLGAPKWLIARMIANTATQLKPSTELPKAIEGLTFTFGARASTSGRVFPEHFLRQAFPGKTPEQIFSRVGFSGDHSRTLQLVQSGAFQVGVMDSIVWKSEIKAGNVDPKQVSVIWESPPFPDYHWVARGDLDKVYGAGFTQKVQDTILGISDPALLAIFARSKFIPAKNEDYKVIEDVATLVGLFNQ